MQPSPVTAQAIEALIQWCAPHALSDSLHPLAPLPNHWFHCQRGLPYPLWIDMARHLFLYRRDQVRTVLDHAHLLRSQRLGARLPGPDKTPFQRQSHDLEQAYLPEDILLYAASANGWQDPRQRLDPHDLPTRLLCSVLSAADHAQAHGSRVIERLSITQMLVHQPSRHHQGLLLSLDLQTLDSTREPNDDIEADHAGQFQPAPAAALLRTDELFLKGLRVVQELLQRVLKPGSPAIGWSFASLALPGDQVQSFSAIEGPSATAALAYGSLYLLRHHLNTALPHVAWLADYLHTIEAPHAVSITADLLPSSDPAQPWPTLDMVDGVPEKLAELSSSLPRGRQVSHCFVAYKQKQAPTVPLDAKDARHLGELVQKIALVTTSLDADARLLHGALQRSDLSDATFAADHTLQAAMERLRSKTSPGQGARAHLVWRYAQLCAGQPSPFGDVAQLGQHFVTLSVEGPSGHVADVPEDTAQARPSLECPRLQDIFYPTEPEHIARWKAVPAWVILAPPFSGKTTLIQHWELTRIREALRDQAESNREGQGWGEVPVFLPMNAFMRHSRLSTPSADDLGRALRAYARLVAPALPWEALLPDEPPAPEQLRTPRPDGLRIRLCIDALNEYRTGQANEGSAIRQLCDWLAPRCDPDQPGALLPPVFSVRREEAGNFELSSQVQPGWRAHPITVHPWGPSQMRAYVRQRRLPRQVEDKLLQALQLPGPEADEPALIAADAQGPANPLASFCQVPGFLSAQCTLLERWPHLQISDRRAHVMLALAWHGLDKWQRSRAFEDLQARSASDPALATLLGWLLPEPAKRALRQLNAGQAPVKHLNTRQAGGLLGGLARVANALQDPNGGPPVEAAPWQHEDDGETNTLPTGLSQAIAGDLQALLPASPTTLPTLHRLSIEWLAQCKASGLAVAFEQALQEGGMPLPWLRFAHQQIQEFFSALSVTPEHLPDLTPPASDVRTEDLDDHLRKDGSKLELPAVTPHTERLRYAADLATTQGAERLIEADLQQGNLTLAAQLAIDQRARLEPPIDESGRVVSHGFWFPERCHPLLQHLRARLLLASVDTGAATLPKLHASGILAGIAGTVQDLPEPWCSQWTPLLPALRERSVAPPAQDPAHGWHAPLTTGVDLRQRLHYGLLLGELGDNIRYERCSAEVPADGDPGRTKTRTGIRLKAAHWALIPASGPGVIHRIGSDRKEAKGKSSDPSWIVPDGALPETLFAHTPVVVMQWKAHADDLRAIGQAVPELPSMNLPRFKNPLLPVTSLNWFQTQTFTAWAAPLHGALTARLSTAGGAHADDADQTPALGLPTEVQHEAAARFNPTHPQPAEQGWWPHDATDHSAPGDWDQPGDLPPTLFNSSHTRWDAPSPVGLFSASWSPTGIEAMGNAWTWCSNAHTKDYRGDNARIANLAMKVEEVQQPHDKEARPTLALRGGSFDDTADVALAAYRFHFPPEVVGRGIGLRWQMSRPIFEP